jgi:hypothetical protein
MSLQVHQHNYFNFVNSILTISYFCPALLDISSTKCYGPVFPLNLLARTSAKNFYTIILFTSSALTSSLRYVKLLTDTGLGH